MNVSFKKSWTKEEILNVLNGKSDSNSSDKQVFTPGALYFTSDDQEIFLATSATQAELYGGLFWGDDDNRDPILPKNEIWYSAEQKLSETTDSLTQGVLTTAFNTTITSHTFSNGKGIITFNGDVTSIGIYAFFGCTSLTSIAIPKSVTSIGDKVFQSCTGLTSIKIPNSVTSIGSDAFYDCSSLTSVTISNSVTSIGSYAFNGCTSLTSINIPSSVTTIDLYIFNRCSSLTSITIPNSVTKISNGAFYNCTSLTSIIYKGTTYTSKSSLTSALTSNGVTVASTAFNNTALPD